MTCTAQQILLEWSNKEKKMEGECSAYGGKEENGVLVGKLDGNRPLVRDMTSKVTLKCTSKEWLGWRLPDLAG